MRSTAIVVLLLISSCASTKPTKEHAFEIQLNESKSNSSGNADIEVRVIKSDGSAVEGLKIKLLDSDLTTETDEKGIARIFIVDALFKDRLKVKDIILPIDLRGLDRVIAIVID